MRGIEMLARKTILPILRNKMEIKTKNRIMNGNQVKVIASRPDTTSRWTIKVDVVTADGNKLPRMSDDDHSYSELEEAFETGFNLLQESE